ncbi:MAG: phosphoglycerate mutase, partial [Gammaproteobacteria bacterium CG22_combo_CG10-13_8_21_14_all_40_8]
DDDVQSVLLIGHNPAFTDFCNKISDANIPNIPTCGYVQLEYHLNSWFDIKANCAELIECIKPKDT